MEEILKNMISIQIQKYKSSFMKYTEVTDLFISGHFYSSGSPYLYTREDVRSEDFNIKVVADISCDIDGPVVNYKTFNNRKSYLWI